MCARSEKVWNTIVLFCRRLSVIFPRLESGQKQQIQMILLFLRTYLMDSGAMA